MSNATTNKPKAYVKVKKLRKKLCKISGEIEFRAYARDSTATRMTYDMCNQLVNAVAETEEQINKACESALRGEYAMAHACLARVKARSLAIPSRNLVTQAQLLADFYDAWLEFEDAKGAKNE